MKKFFHQKCTTFIQNAIFLYHVNISMHFLSYFSASYASVLTILSFSLERYLAICTPLYIFPMSDIKRAALVNINNDNDNDNADDNDAL